jgi:hypothetical protein
VVFHYTITAANVAPGEKTPLRGFDKILEK